MKRFQKALLAAAMVVSILSNGASATVLFEENFETYPVGSNASDKFYAPWEGWSVTEEAGSKIFRSRYNENSDFLLYTDQQFAGNAAIEFMSRTTNPGGLIDISLTSYYTTQAPAPGDWSIGFVYNNAVLGINSGWYDEENKYQSLYVPLGTARYLPNVWHDVNLTLDGNLARFYVDQTLLGEYDFSPLPFSIENYYLTWMTWGQRDLDNITISTTPVPEPATLALFALGLAWLGLARLKKM